MVRDPSIVSPSLTGVTDLVGKRMMKTFGGHGTFVGDIVSYLRPGDGMLPAGHL